MDTREFKINESYHMTAKLHTGPGPYLYRTPDGREATAAAGEYLLYEGDKIIGHLPARIVDAMALEVDELVTVERARMFNDHQETVDVLKVEVGPGEKFDGMKVVDKDGQVVEGKSLVEALPMRLASTDDLKLGDDGNLTPKDEDDRKVDAVSKEQAIFHPVNRFNEASQRAAREVALLAEANKTKEFEEVTIGDEVKFREILPELESTKTVEEKEEDRLEKDRRAEAERMNSGIVGSGVMGQQVPPKPTNDDEFLNNR